MNALHVRASGGLHRDLGERRTHRRHPLRKGLEAGGYAAQVVDRGHEPHRGSSAADPARVRSAALPVRLEFEVAPGRAQAGGLGQEPDPVVFASREPSPFLRPAHGGDQPREEWWGQAPEQCAQIRGRGPFERVQPELDQVERPGLGGGRIESRAQLRHRRAGDRERQPRPEVGRPQRLEGLLLGGPVRSRAPHVGLRGFPVEGRPALQHQGRLLGGRDAGQGWPRVTVFRSREPLAQHGNRRADPVDGSELPEAGNGAGVLHDASPAVNDQPVAGDAGQDLPFLFPEPLPAETLHERGDRAEALLQQLVRADPLPASRPGELPGRAALARSPRADEDDVRETGPRRLSGSGHYAASSPETRIPVSARARQKPGNDLATTSGLRMRTPGRRRPVSASAIAIRWSP